ncbi:hypothetical protein BJ912DRAFT_985413 [Pholiota molesta]|nr:hypothetical protein BJ912DRAFT_985413 [Pholiota molesta]
MSATSEDMDPVFWIGPIFIGCMLDWLLMGTVIVQTFYFHLRRSRDRNAIQVLVYAIVILDSIQTAFTTHNAWWLNVVTFGQDLRPVWSASTIPGTAGLTSAMVQIFYAWRIYKLSQSRSYMHGFAIVIVIMALAQCAASFVSSSAIGITDLVEFETKLTRLYPAISSWLGISFCNDITISACMIFILSGAKMNVTKVSRTNKLLDKLIVHAIQTGTVTAVCAGINLLLFLRFSKAFYYIAPGMIAGKLYTNSLLSTLNSRDMGESRSVMSDRDTISMRVHVSRMTERVEDLNFRTSLPQDDWMNQTGSDSPQKKPEEI